ncbi:MAG: CotH kinase family protein, partial [Verrucomicrobiota bacterium]
MKSILLLLAMMIASPMMVNAQLVISEFLAINDSINQDGDGGFSDWIEIHNPTENAVALEGFVLTDDPEFDLGEADTFWRLPAGQLAAGGYLIVFASGKDRSGSEEWHADFSLGESEYLALVTPDGLTKLTEFGPDYPRQRTDISYGLKPGTVDQWQYFKAPTPGKANNSGFDGFVADTKFSVDRGFHREPFQLEITTATEGATIYYTTDGRTPSKGNIFSGPIGAIYDGPITVDATAVIRAVALKTGFESTNVDTHTYIFVEDVIRQSADQEGWPTEWLGDGGNGTFPADYEMDPEVTEDPAYKDLMDDALLALPSLSLVTDPDHLFSTRDGIYQRPQQSGPDWERPVSAELIHPDGTRGFQIDAGVRIQGGHTREPAKNPKHSFRLLFKKEYGAAKLNYRFFEEDSAVAEFDTLILRGGGNQSWLHHNTFLGDNRGRAQYVRDQWAKDAQRAMGHPGAHNRMVHLYINGLYWGLYNPTERPTAAFGESYLGGVKEDYDALNSGEAKDGDLVAYNDLFDRARKDLADQANYDALTEVLDIEGFTDYMILNQYGGNLDWDHHNWYAMRNRNGGKWRFFAWDSEFFFIDVEDNVITDDNARNPSEIFQELVKNEDYVRYLGDRIQKHLFNDGVLTEAAVLESWEKRSADVELALVGESARWGDYRRDVHSRGTPLLLLTRDGAWMDERNRLLNDYFPKRNEEVIKQYRRLNLYPIPGAPEFQQHGGSVNPDAEVKVSIPGSIFTPRGDIYITTDGSDPRKEDGSPNPAA